MQSQSNVQGETRSMSNKNANVFVAIKGSETSGKKLKREFATNALESVGFRSSHTLKAHYSCVNTIEFSKGCADLMCSGSDDKRVLLWNIAGGSFDKGPIKAFIGHLSNIFCAVFSSDNRFIISCGNDDHIFRYDVEKNGKNPTTHNVKYPYVSSVNRYQHEAAVYRVSIKPDADEVFVSASDDNTVALWDVRSSEPQGRIKSKTSFNCVEFNHTNMYNNNTAYRYNKRPKAQPAQNTNNENNSNNKDEKEDEESNINDECFYSDYGINTNLFTTCSASQGIQLWDLRKCFGETSQPLMHYDLMGSKEATSISFNTAGDHFVASIPRFYPVLYKVHEEAPLAVFYAEEFKNSCTAKSCCFAGENEEYIVSGSDDFKVYIWKVPSKQQLNEHVLQASGIHTNNNNDSSSKSNGTEYEEPVSSSPTRQTKQSKTRKINLDVQRPSKVKKLKMSGHEFVMTVNSPKEVLKGHRSIVNNVRYNYSYAMLASSGVEKTIKLWSPLSLSDDTPPTEIPKRQYSAMDYLNLLHSMRFMDREDATLEESENTLALFDFFKAYENSDSSSDIDDEDIDNDDDDELDSSDDDEEEFQIVFE